MGVQNGGITSSAAVEYSRERRRRDTNLGRDVQKSRVGWQRRDGTHSPRTRGRFESRGDSRRESIRGDLSVREDAPFDVRWQSLG